jgi:uncharacterized protein YecA (UPF0149 family)
MEFGPEGRKLFEQLARGAAYLDAGIEVLERERAADAKELAKTRESFVGLVTTLERVMRDLMEVSDATRREALDEFRANEGRATDDGALVARPVKVGRNDACPCGSGKKWKKCCGGVSRAH